MQRQYLGLPPLLAWPALWVMIVVSTLIFTVCMTFWALFVIAWYGVSAMIATLEAWRESGRKA